MHCLPETVRTNQRGVCCDACDLWTHASCARVGNEEYAKLSSDCDLEWLCPTCVLANLPFPDLNQCCTDEHPSTDNNSHLDVSATEATVSSDDDGGEAVEGGEPLHSIWECTQGLLVSHLNVRSLASKFDQIKFLLGSQTRTNMVFGISETWLDEGVTNGELEIAGFRSYRRDRDGRGGGVIVYVSDDVKGMRRHDLENDEIEAVWIQVKMRRRHVLIGNVYRPPGTRDTWMESLVVMLEKVVQEQMTVVMMGDFNCNMLNPDSHTSKLGMVMSEYGMEQMIHGPTRVTQTSKTLIDLLFCTNSDEIVYSGRKELGLSDHDMIYGILNGKVEEVKQCLREVRVLGNCDVEKLVADLKVAPWSVMETLDDMDSQWEFWKKLFTEVLDSHVPLKRCRVRRKTLPWISPRIRMLMKERIRLCKKAKKTKQAEDWEHYRNLRNTVTTEMRKAKLQFFERVSKEAKTNPRKAWKEISRLLGSGRRHVTEVKTAGGTLTDQKSIVEEFSEYFSTLVGALDEGVDKVVKGFPVCDHEFSFTRVEEEEVLKLLRGLDVNKAVGVDAISAKLLRIAAPGISASLASLFNHSLESGQIPQEWKSANVTPVQKGGSNVDISNFRPVSVLPVVSKVFERLLHQQLYDYLQHYSILHPVQSGFRPQHTTQDVLVSMVDNWRKALDENELVGVAMVDLSKAFDMVNHSILLRKMYSYGVRGMEWKWFQDYLTGRRQRVCVGDEKSSWTNIHKGVPQGSILGPLLFTMYVNDLPKAVSQCNVKQYADDTTMFHAANSASELEAVLEKDLNSVCQWVDENKLKLNVKKTQLLLLGRKGRAQELEDVNVTLNGEQLSRSRTVKCLGVSIDDGLTWREHIESLRRKCFCGLAKLRKLREVLPTETKRKVYNALVLPHLDYCSVVWQECTKELQQKVERIQNYGMRLILSKPPRTPSAELRTALGWTPLTERRRLSRLALVHRCVHKKCPEYMKDMLVSNETVGCRMTRGFEKLHLFRVNTELFRRSFTFRGSQDWNSLPENIRNIHPATVFKKATKRWLGEQLF